ncbi:MAG: hypothetical protein II119_04090 [Bacilli bacterium]|nr:hypothetical protein [Bacilli bacterium]
MEKENFDDRKKAVVNFGRDSAILTLGLLKNDPKKLDFNVVIKYIEFLKKKAEKIRDDYYPKNNPITPDKLDDLSFDANLPIK